MDATIRATCPSCRSPLKIPAKWAGQAVKCKKCGAVVRAKARSAPTAGGAETAPHGPTTSASPAVPGVPAAAPHGFQHQPEPLPLSDGAPVGPAAFEELTTARGAPRYNPFEGDEAPAPAYPYPVPPAGYPYPLPPGYPYAPPPGYGPPPGYPVPPGYPYPAPPGPTGEAPPAGYPYPVLPAGYPYPVPPTGAPMGGPVPVPAPLPLPDPVPESSVFKADLGAVAARGRYQRRSTAGKLLWVGVAVVLTIGLAVGAVVGVPVLKKWVGQPEVADGGGKGDPKEKPGQPAANPNRSPLVSAGSNFPRRLLFVHISDYAFLNPLTSAEVRDGTRGPDRTVAAARRLAFEWRVSTAPDNNQLFVLSDTAPPPEGRLPMKPVVMGAYERFFETSRAQDRVVVYFGGHVLAKKKDDKDVTYLVPFEGDPDDEATLIPLADFYAKLEACKATQKVVIWDVCRFNPDRGRQRPGSEPMTEELAKALTAAPTGVQVVLTSQPGENALEFNSFTLDRNDRYGVAGSSFLESVRYVAEKNRGGLKALDPNDPLPVDEWAGAVGKRVGEVAAGAKQKQTVKVAGGPPPNLAAYDAAEAKAPRFDFPAPPPGAPPAEVGEIAGELSLPGIKSDGADLEVGKIPFPADALKDYATDIPAAEILKPENREKYLFRVTVVEALETVREVWGKGKIREDFTEKTSDDLKKKILKEQDYPAGVIPRLERAITLLEAVEPMKATEPKRWQAHWEYAMGQCKARLAYMHEYNLALGGIRTEVLPQLDEKKGEDGYRLVSTDKMRIKREARYAEEAREHFQKLIDEHKGTPWALLAKRDKSIALGLAWQPFNSKAVAESDMPK